jgi:SAM-dependent methyltransferase
MEPAGARHDFQDPLPSAAAQFREALAAAGFTDQALIEKFGSVALPTRRTRNLPRLMRQTEAGTPGDILARLFLFCVPVPAEALRNALAPFPLEELGRMGLVEARGADVASTVVLYPYGPYLLLFDPPEQVLSGAPRDLVMGVTTSTTDLANFTIRRPVANMLDVGCGGGFHAFMASPHARRVTGVDVSSRAVAFARMGAALSGLSNIEFLTGDRFEPVRGMRFDLIAGNLPFAITPGRRYLYRDGGMQLDAFVQSVLRAAPEYLAEGGLCQMMCDWVRFQEQDWAERLRGWFEGSGCDVWVLRLTTAKPLLYAEAWIRDTEEDTPEHFAEAYNEWTAWYDANGITGISTGLILLRRRSAARNWFRTAEWPEHLPEGFGRHAALRLALYDFLETVPDDASLLESRLTLPPNARLVTSNQWAPDGWHVTDARVVLEGLSGYAANVSAHAVRLLGFCDGQRTLRDAVTYLAAALKVDPERVAGPCLPLVRSLLAGGFLHPAGLDAVGDAQ